MIHPDELDRFILTFTEAVAHGQSGRTARGYFLLRDGLLDAERCADPESVSPQPEALRTVWRSGLRSFRQQFPTPWYPEEE